MTAPSEQDLVQLNALADGELEPVAASMLAARVAEDAALRARYETILAAREAVSGLPRPVVSDALLRRIETRLDAPPAPSRSAAGVAALSGWRTLAASVLVTALLASGTTYLLMPHPMSTDELIASGHRRSLLAASAVDIASSDRHTVKPWLDARLGISPPAPDLATQGYPLVGGRVEVIGQAPVPALIYRHNEHTISLVAIPGGTTPAAAHEFASGGYNMVRWSGNGFDFWAVSDLEPAELEAFAQDYQAATALPAGR